MNTETETKISKYELHNDLINACIDGDIDQVRYLLDQGADVNAQDGEAFRIASKNQHIELFRFLIHHKAQAKESVIDFREKLHDFVEIMHEIKESVYAKDLPRKENMDMSKISPHEKAEIMVYYNITSYNDFNIQEIPFWDELRDLDPSGDMRRAIFFEYVDENDMISNRDSYFSISCSEIENLCESYRKPFAFDKAREMLFKD